MSYNKELVSVRRRGEIAAALIKAVEIFSEYNEDSLDVLMGNGLKPIAAVAGLDRVAIYKLLNDKPHDPLRLGLTYLWAYGRTVAPDEGLLILLDSPPVARWIERLARGECINADARNVPEDEAKLLALAGVRAVYFVPVFKCGKFWGIVAMADYTLYRLFEDDCLDMLRAAARLSAGAFIRAEMERDMTEMNEYNSAMLAGAPIGLTVFDDTLRMVACNGAITQVLNTTKQHFIENFHEYAPADLPDGKCPRQVTTELLTRALNGETVTFEWNHQSADGKRVPFEITLIRVKRGDRFVVLAYQYDMSHIKNLMEALRCKNEQLVEALERAKAASKAKGAFLSNMSHEMRTPLNTISGMALIGKNASDPERKDYALDKIREAAMHLLGVISDILDMSKIEANKLELVKNEFSFEKTLKKAVNSVSFDMERKRQRFHAAIDEKIPHLLMGDDQRLTQVILNLLSNAVKFTPECGSIRLRARLLEQTDSVSAVAVEVSDTGIGITPEQQARLFHAFEQADNGISRQFGGTGLGLALSKRIVEKMDGAFHLVSTPGQGSTFSFTFRAARGSAAGAPLLEPSINWETVNVLVVDDEEDSRLYCGELFARRKMRCDVAASAEEALRRIEECRYDIYFVDWNMPGMSGLELAKRIKADGAARREKTVVVMISAPEWTRVRDEADTGIDRYLLKPLFTSDIINCLNASMGASANPAPGQRCAVAEGELQGFRILLAEDVDINREILLTLMEPSGAEIDCAENGLEALRLAQENPGKYDLIFMDMQMPKMDGLEATRRIRLFDAKTPIVAMTANVFQDDIETCLAAGMDGHLGKPLDPENIMKIVRSFRRVDAASLAARLSVNAVA